MKCLPRRGLLLLGSHISCVDYATLGLFCNNCVNEFPNYVIAPEGYIASHAHQKLLDLALFGDRWLFFLNYFAILCSDVSLLLASIII